MRLKMIFALVGVALLICAPLIQADTTTSTTDSVDQPPVRQIGRTLVYTMSIEGAIGAVTAERISEAIEIAEDEDAELLIIFLDTPGGFTNSTWEISKSILNSHVPVCVYIAPLGATAGSAGVYITYSAHFAAMAPTANIGAAHPVGGGGEEIDSVMNEKITNDAAAKIRATAEKWGRNGEWAERAVRESVSITASEALDSNVVEIIAADIDDLIDQLDGRKIGMPYGEKTMSLARVDIEEIDPSFAQLVLQIITSPEIVLLLFSIGGLGITLELYNPGSIFPGVVGAISLILAFYGMQTLPINVAGLALIVLAIALWIAEIKVISHGVLFVGGLVSFFFGGLMLVDSVDPALQISLSFLIWFTVVFAAVFGLIIWLVIRAHRRMVAIGDEGMPGKIAEVRTKGQVYVDGALWKAECDEELVKGDKVEIVSVDKLLLNVKKINSK
ncbi:MAG: nodulation protein NfeD [candidate division Zixibacteria bacterium]|nr:nodulation protein NfeD [candidate division Zixibacteria bacterium]